MNDVIHGKVKSVFPIDAIGLHEDLVKIVYHDKVTAGNGRAVDYPQGKGAVCCQISELFFKYFQDKFLTHYVSCPKPNEMICKRVNIIPVEVVVRNIATGSIVRQTNLQEGMVFDPPLVEFYLKDDAKDDPLLTDDRVKLMGYNPMTFRRRAREMNWHFTKIFDELDIHVVDYKLEFGNDDKGALYLADEISPDSMRLWKKSTRQRYDKDLFRKNEGDIVKAYQHVLDELRKIPWIGT